MQSSTTPDPGYQWESDKLTVDTTNESQEVSPFPAGDQNLIIVMQMVNGVRKWSIYSYFLFLYNCVNDLFFVIIGG